MINETFAMADYFTSNTRKLADNVVCFLEGFLVSYCLLRMLETILLELGYAGLSTEALAIALYLVFSAHVCMLLSWPWDSLPQTGSSTRTRIYIALVLGCILLAEVCLAVCGLVLTWTGLLWDVMAMATVQAVLFAFLFIAYDRRHGKFNRIQPVAEIIEVPPLRRRRPGG